LFDLYQFFRMLLNIRHLAKNPASRSDVFSQTFAAGTPAAAATLLAGGFLTSPCVQARFEHGDLGRLMSQMI
jgi:hypothetical protein